MAVVIKVKILVTSALTISVYGVDESEAKFRSPSLSTS